MAHLVDGHEIPSLRAFELLRTLVLLEPANGQVALGYLAWREEDRRPVEELARLAEELERAGLVFMWKISNPFVWTVSAYEHAHEFAERLPEIRSFLVRAGLAAPGRLSALAE